MSQTSSPSRCDFEPTVTVLTTTHRDVLDLLPASARSVLTQRPFDERPVPDIRWSIGVDGTTEDVRATREALREVLSDSPLSNRTRVTCTGRRVGDTCAAQTVALVKGFRTAFTVLNDGDDRLTPEAVARMVYGCVDANVWWAVGAKERLTLDANHEVVATTSGADISHLVGVVRPGQLYPPDYTHIDNLVAASALTVRTPLLNRAGFRAHANANDTALLAYLSCVSSGLVVPEVTVSKVEHCRQKSKQPGFHELLTNAHVVALGAARLHAAADALLGVSVPPDANRTSAEWQRSTRPGNEG